MATQAPRTKVFISYSHKDRDCLERLQIFLKSLGREAAVEWWDDTMIRPGQKWRDQIRRALRTAKVAVLLVSQDFLSSDFITTDELPSLLAAAENEGVAILPVIIKPCRFKQTKSLSQFQAVNDPSKPLKKMSKVRQEDLWVKVTDEIEKALNRPVAPPAGAGELAAEISSEIAAIKRSCAEWKRDVRKLPPLSPQHYRKITALGDRLADHLDKPSLAYMLRAALHHGADCVYWMEKNRDNKEAVFVLVETIRNPERRPFFRAGLALEYLDAILRRQVVRKVRKELADKPHLEAVIEMAEQRKTQEFWESGLSGILPSKLAKQMLLEVRRSKRAQ